MALAPGEDPDTLARPGGRVDVAFRLRGTAAVPLASVVSREH